MLSSITRFIVQRFPVFIGGYFLLQILVRLITTSGVVIDESEQVMLTQYFALGYNAQPPLYTWVQMIFFSVFGNNIFAISLLKNLVLFSIYLFTYLTALRLTHNQVKAALSSLGLLFLPQIVWEAQIDQIHTVLLTASAAALFFCYFYTVEKQNTAGFLAIGIVAACGMLAKYNFVIVLFALLVATIAVKEYRQRLLNRKLLLSILIFLISVLPHFIWVLGNFNLATTETLNRMSMDQQGTYFLDVLHGSGELVLSYIAFVLVFFLVFVPLFRKHFSWRNSPEIKLLLTYIAVTFLAVFLIILLTQATNIKERWLQPYLFIVPLIAFLCTDIISFENKRIRIFSTFGLFFCALVLLIIPTRTILVDLDSKPHRENYPFKALAAEMKRLGLTDTLILAEDKFIGGNVKLFFPDSTVITPSIPLQKYEPQESVVVVWKKEKPIDYLSGNWEATSSEPQKIVLPFRYSEKFDATFYAQRYTLSQLLGAK